MRKSKKDRIREKREILRNKKLCKKYPWLIPWKGWRGNKQVFGWRKPWKKYSYIMWDFWPRGWNKSFGDQFLKDLGEAVEKAGIKDQFHVYEGKEKYGQMRIDCSPYTYEIDEIVSVYETISEHICISCGKPDTWMICNGGWFSPECFDCYKMSWRTREKYYHKDQVATDEEILNSYEECRCGDTQMIPDSIEISKYYSATDGPCKYPINIKPTADKIRARFRK